MRHYSGVFVVIKIGVLGAKGRMGKGVVQLLETEYVQKANVAARAGRGEPLDSLLETDVVIDFSLPVGMLALARAAANRQSPLPAFVIGSTGWKLDERRELEKLAERTPIFMSSNFSTGVMILQEILKTAAPLLERQGYTPIILETHHRHKKDAPSGTALSLQRSIAPAGPGNVQTQCIRAGEVIGDHEVTFYGAGDKLVLGHYAQDRSIFARGALDVAIWLAGRRTGPQPLRGLIGTETFFKEKILCLNSPTA